ncbi:squalene epoxidase-domain-containing protein [Radiomyces spectabilis]|uniref:squalene epoxidase-domain-containing protein n=1 Tax=Radiomyces spectabilis TaxID=64574 RepID=UPI00222011DA|nr:squalene epoxidase-domain-containing protein [Radiomyces spectabilis]KAI8393931.1 squalene epoxidase-domain-containing protein [Radiomyces spectabilis]
MATNVLNNEFDLILVGGGVVGCTAAKAFGTDGRRVLLLERDLTEPDRIVGELMQPGGVNALKQLDMEDTLQGIDGIPCRGYSVYRNGEFVEIPYPDNPLTGRPAEGLSFHHGRFIQNLRKEASATKNVTIKEMTVMRLLNDNVDEKCVGVVAQTKDGKEEKYYAPLTLVADGIFSKFRKEFTSKLPDVRSHFVGFIVKDLVLPSPEHGFVTLAKPSPVLMYQIGTHETRVLVDVPGELPSNANGDLKKYIQSNIVPQMPESMRGAFEKALETERLRVMPNGFLPPSPNQVNGAILLGDAMNIRHPLTGGGMTVAINDVILLRELLSPENIPSFTESDLVIQAMGAFHWKRKRYCVSINVLAMSLYRLFAANDPNLVILQNGCFNYFLLGGDCVKGPVSLLSGLLEKPLALVYHFYAVAFYALYLEFKRGGVKGLPVSIMRIFTVLYAACVTILPYIWSECKS